MLQIPILESERNAIEPKLSEFIKLIGCMSDPVKAYIFMEFVKRNNKEMIRLKEKYKK